MECRLRSRKEGAREIECFFKAIDARLKNGVLCEAFSAHSLLLLTEVEEISKNVPVEKRWKSRAVKKTNVLQEAEMRV